jgi:hypothetical protein
MRLPGYLHCTVTLIHNNQASRNGYAVPLLEALSQELGANFTKVGWQPPPQIHSYRLSLRREIHYLILELRWAKYRRLGRIADLRVAWSFLAHRFPKFIGMSKSLAQWRRRSFIETSVTAKHILAWQTFLESDSQFLLCCEDDVIFRPDSVARVRALFETGLPERGDILFYADLAGGLDAAQLQIHELVDSTPGDRIVYKQPTTNTACCYLLSRGLAENFMNQISLKPSLRLVGIDWMMNAMFMSQRAEGINCKCIHFSPTLFGHGTFTGEYVSWQREAPWP